MSAVTPKASAKAARLRVAEVPHNRPFKAQDLRPGANACREIFSNSQIFPSRSDSARTAIFSRRDPLNYFESDFFSNGLEESFSFAKIKIGEGRQPNN